jgi:C1A family cysteine protease
MKIITSLLIFGLSCNASAALPDNYLELLPYVQPAPDQAETNSCWFMASTGAMELLLNKRDQIENPKVGEKNDLSESFLIWQKDFYDPTNLSYHFIEEVVKKFNHREAIHIKEWPYTGDVGVWENHPNYEQLPRLSVPEVDTVFLFSRGKRWATNVLTQNDIQSVKEALVTYEAPIIVNYNDDGFWHVVLIVGYDDKLKGTCYEVEAEDCNQEGAFFVRDSDGQRYEARAYNWFLYNGNAAAVVKFKSLLTE